VADRSSKERIVGKAPQERRVVVVDGENEPQLLDRGFALGRRTKVPSGSCRA
jgi:hypothetical protein